MAAVVTTTTTTNVKSEGSPAVSLVMILVGGVGILLGLIALTYAGVGANLAFEGSGVVDLQAKCVKTFSSYSDDTYISYNGGQCGTADPYPINTNGKIPTVEMCELNQSFVGCSTEEYKTAFAVSTQFGLGCSVAAAIFCLLGSVPVVLNGVFGFLNKQAPAQVTAGVGIGLAIPSCCAITICAAIMIISSAIAEVVNSYGNWAKGVFNELGTGLCSPECRQSRDATIDLFKHIQTYFDVLRNINVAMIILMLVEAIMACVSCTTWKKQMRVSTDHHQPVVIAGGAPVATVQPVVVSTSVPVVQPAVVQPTAVKAEAPVVGTQVVVESSSVPKTES